MRNYYNKRAKEYDDVYLRKDPASQTQLADIGRDLQDTVRGRRVLEVASGTGYWTEKATLTALHVTGIDFAPEMIKTAETKKLPQEKVAFRAGDAYALTKDGGPFDAAFAMFWFSHIPRSRIGEFLTGLNAVLEPGSPVMMADNQFSDIAGGEFVRKSGEEDTFRIRTLADGTRHEIIKNYFDEAELSALFLPFGSDLKVTARENFWWVRYRTP